MPADDTPTDDVPDNDYVVGTAMRVSLSLLAVVAAVAGVLFVLQMNEPEIEPDEEDVPVLPQVRELPELEIPAIPFVDVTESAGIDFVHENGAGQGTDAERLLPETMGGGGAFFDFDADGDQDIICVNSTVWPWAQQQPETTPTSALYKNDGSGHFTNITSGSGLDVSFYGNGVACGDFDNDGLVDLYITAVGPNRLFRNAGGGKFEDITASADVAGSDDGWSTGCGWFDYDLDGDLDLFVSNYIEWSREKDLSFGFKLDGTQRAYGRPTEFRGTFPLLYRNDGAGKFTDISNTAGVRIRNPDTDEPMAKSLGLTFADVNSDGRLDVVIANDTVQNLLLINRQDGTFIENAQASGIAFDNNGKARGAMGIDAACFRNSDAMGITIGNFANEMTALYVCQTPGLPVPIYRDEAVSNGIGPVTRVQLTFGVMFADIDLDGRLDILSCNGHLEDDIQKVQASQYYEQPPQLLWNCGVDYDNEFMVVPEEKVGADFTRRMVGRGATRADIDGDGDLDVLLLSSGGTPRLLRNDQQTDNHWLRFHLTGSRSNRDAIGATVRVTLPDDTILTRTVMPTCSYQSQVELPLTFGLGSDNNVKSVKVTWPNGQVTDVSVTAVDQQIDVIEP
ncbi:MAG: CRTAC1 family protein [Fuerstiella sp.]|nr:CRTAC1 family protein [Fuerstiella sp.]MCP4857408.1 CRTAC1 family protein [Fuerstiella sp.]